jgi:Aldolase/RraA
MSRSTNTRSFRLLNVAAMAAILLLALVFGVGLFLVPRAFSKPAEPLGDAALLEGYRHVEVASVSDAMEKLTGQRIFMSHRMRPIFTSKFAGFALTVRLKKEENHDPDALQGMLAAIDGGGANSVYVMVVDDGIDIAGMGGLMGTAMAASTAAYVIPPTCRKSVSQYSHWARCRRPRSATIASQEPIFPLPVMEFP